VLANIAPRGSQEVWSLLLRRVEDDNMLGPADPARVM
jgi:hypothetical protein